MSKFEFHLSERLESVLQQDEDFVELYEKFKTYKQKSEENEIAAPTRNTQEVYPGLMPDTFGRDRFFKSPDEAKKEDLTHLHIWTEDKDWIDHDDESGDYKVQWDCTSDAYLIYSYFKYEDVHHFYIIAFIDKKAHLKTKDLPNGDPNPIVLQWLAKAISYRTDYVQHQQQ